MAQVVSIIGVSHSPFLPNIFRRYPDIPESDRRSYENYQAMHDRLADAKPDVLIAVGTDHFNHFFLDNMPAWSIAKCPETTGPYPQEGEGFNLPPYKATVDVDLAKTLIREGFNKGVDFAYSDDAYIEHSISLPMAYIRPEMDLSIVPVYCNVLAPPIPPAQRFYDVGRAISSIVQDLPASTRVGVVASGHLAIDVGGPKMASGSVDPDWDRKVVGLIRDGDTAAVLAEAEWENLHKRGTVTPGFLSFVLLMGMASGAKPSFAEVIVSETHGSTPFLVWD
jgi:protocatechuate 4,5-dioxygenase, beta chain